jgi:hypothetical protein
MTTTRFQNHVARRYAEGAVKSDQAADVYENLIGDLLTKLAKAVKTGDAIAAEILGEEARRYDASVKEMREDAAWRRDLAQTAAADPKLARRREVSGT